MEENLKQLLLKDLAARLPYGIICKYWAEDYAKDCGDFIHEDEGKLESISLTNREAVIDITCVDLDTDIIKPYLRPMSSMTEEERKEMGEAIKKDHISPYGEVKTSGVDNLLLSSVKGATNLIDWLNKKMFAYRTYNGKDMFELGLAIPAPEGMY